VLQSLTALPRGSLPLAACAAGARPRCVQGKERGGPSCPSPCCCGSAAVVAEQPAGGYSSTSSRVAGFAQFAPMGNWVDHAPDDSILTVHDTSLDELFALQLETP
jgi:hypothetical protein